MADDDQQREAAIAAATAIGMTLPEETIAGVIANRALLAQHLTRVKRAITDGTPHERP